MMQIAWWHWLIGGMIIMALELIVPSLFLLWVGLAAVIVGILAGLMAIPLAVQFFIWAVLSVIFMWLWFKVIRQPDRSLAGQGHDSVVGAKGLLVRDITELSRGEVLFQSPVLGSDRWPATADMPISSGERVQVVGVQAQILKVAPVRPLSAAGSIPDQSDSRLVR